MNKEPKNIMRLTKRLGKFNGRHMRYLIKMERQEEMRRLLGQAEAEAKKGEA